VCAVCLGRLPRHDMRSCQALKTWDRKHDTFAKRTTSGHLVAREGNNPLCLDWQRPSGCSTRTHDNRHLCSGCGDVSHGATLCRRAKSE
ncbi:hypothetical protein FIBSPDRAFT_722575, partial [Athelia psychrophila]